MYEAMTYEVLLERMMERALEHDRKQDSREGSMLWYGQAPAAVELQNLYIALDTILRETFADTASREYLILRAAERGLSPLKATPAILQLSVTPPSLPLEVNTRFSIGQLNYYVSEDLGGGNYAITCETPGEAGNDHSRTVIPIEYVDGLETCTVTALLVPGEEEEETQAFRQRYFDSLATKAFGGNRTDYIQKVNAIPGVGGVKIYRAWNGGISPADLKPPAEAAEWMAGLSGVPDGVKTWLDKVYQAGEKNLLTVGGTVKLVIIDSTFSAPSEPLVNTVQTAIDPIQNAGEGVGLAPIGHVVKVEGVASEKVNLSFTLDYQDGWSWDDVQPYVTQTIQAYFKELAETWADQEASLVVRVSQIESRLLAITGIVDISSTQINGIPANYTLPLDHIPVLGEMTAT